jgi:ribosomal protein L11 methyltransferase
MYGDKDPGGCGKAQQPDGSAMSTSDTSFCALISTSEAEARQMLDALAESFDSAEVVIAASEERDGRWTVSLHFREAPNETAVRALIGLAAGAESANALVFETVGATDWVQASLQGLTPVAAGRFVVHGAHDRARVPPNRIGIEIEAALAFGTGHHGTTRGCLLALDRLAKRRPRGGNARVLDLGTGSGVLAIAAARALRRPVLASDNDARAVQAARANARRNRAGAAVEVNRADGLRARRFSVRGRFDLIFANILLAPLARMATPMARLTAAHGYVVLSGLLAAQGRAALAVYRARGLVLAHRIPLEGWVTLVLRAPSRSLPGKRRRARGAVAARAHGQ